MSSLRYSSVGVAVDVSKARTAPNDHVTRSVRGKTRPGEGRRPAARSAEAPAADRRFSALQADGERRRALVRPWGPEAGRGDFEREGEIVGRVEALPTRFSRHGDDRRHAGRDRRLVPDSSGGSSFRIASSSRPRCRAGTLAPREHLEQHHPEGEDVRAVDRLSPDLLGRH